MTNEYSASDMNGLFKPFHSSFIGNPYPFFELARQSVPVFYSDEAAHWVISRYEDVKRILLDHDTFSARNTLTPMTPLCEEAQQALREGGWRLQPALGNQDRPHHTRFRKHLMRALTSRTIMEQEAFIGELMNSLIDKIESKGKADLVEELIFSFPARVILKMLGFSPEKMDVLITGGKNRNQYIFGQPSKEEQIELARQVAGLFKHASELVELRKADPHEDITSVLLELRDDEGLKVFTDDEVASVLFAFLTAGHETTASLLGNAIRQLLTDRSDWEKICKVPSLIPNTVEEMLRYDSSVIAWRRFTNKDVEINGVTIPGGSQMLLLLGSANRDEAIFETPDRFDITRENANRHLSFGKGVHSCFGNVLARLEMKVALEVISARLPGLELVEGQAFEYMPNCAFRTLYHLYAKW